MSKKTGPQRQSSLPWFKFFAGEYLSNQSVRLMSLEARGLYIDLLCWEWTHESLPSDISELARLCGVPENTLEALWPKIEPMFKRKGDRLVHPGLEEHRKSLLLDRERRSEAGKKGAKVRWNNEKDGNALASRYRDTDAESDTESENGRISGEVAAQAKNRTRPVKARLLGDRFPDLPF